MTLKGFYYSISYVKLLFAIMFSGSLSFIFGYALKNENVIVVSLVTIIIGVAGIIDASRSHIGMPEKKERL
jgi:hypothetical protein